MICLGFIAMLNMASAPTVLVGCDGCTQMEMQAVAQDKAAQLADGTYNLHVLNVIDADHQHYLLEVSEHGHNLELISSIRAIQPAPSPLEEAKAARLRERIADLTTITEVFWRELPSPLTLPEQFSYKSTIDALSYPDGFAASLSHLLNTQNLESKALLLQLNADIDTIAAELNSDPYAISLVAGSLHKKIPKRVLFRDGSQLEVTLLLGYSLSDGLILEVKPPQPQQ